MNHSQNPWQVLKASPLRWKALIHVYVVFCCLSFASIAINFGTTNWDSLAYVASVKKLSSDDAIAIHREVYEEAKLALDDQQYKALTSQFGYRETMRDNAELFNLQLPYYQIRVVYIRLLAVIEKLGISLFDAGHLVSGLSTALAAYILFIAFRDSISPLLWVLFPAVFLLSGGLDLARMYSPDALAFLMFALVLLAFAKAHVSFFAILVLSVAVRTDLILLVALATGFMIVFRPSLRAAAIAVIIAAALLYVGINSYAGNMGWSAVHYYVFESSMLATDPRLFADYTVSPADYFFAIAANLPKVVFFPQLWFFVFSLGVVVWLKLSSEKNVPDSQRGNQTQLTALWQTLKRWSGDPLMVVSITCFLYFVGHFLMFPLLDTRFFVGPYMIVGFCALAFLSLEIERLHAL